MKQIHPFQFAVIGGGVLACMLRIQEARTGFEPETGLPIAENLWRILLPVALIALIIVFFLILRKTAPGPQPSSSSFTDCFRASSALSFLPLVALLPILYSGVSSIMAFRISREWTDALCAATALVMAASLFPMARWFAFPGHNDADGLSFSPNLLLFPPVALVVRFVAVYRVVSINPVLAAYWPEFLALAAITLAFYRLAGFDFQRGNTWIFLFWSALAVALSAAGWFDPGISVADKTFLGGCGFFLWVMLTLRLSTLNHTTHKVI